MKKIAKAVTTFIASGVTVVGVILGESVVAWATPELVGSVGTLAATLLVWQIPNKG